MEFLKCPSLKISFIIVQRIFAELLGGYFMPQIMEDLDKPSCVMCEFFMSRIKSWLQDGHTVDELEGDLKKICSLLPGTVTV